MDAFVEHIKALPYFGSLSAGQLEALAGHAVRMRFRPDQMIFSQGDDSAGLWWIEAGRVKVFRVNHEGREHIFRIAGPGETFNDIPALDGQPCAASVIALSAVIAWMLPSRVLIAELRRNPDLATAVIRMLTGRVRSLVDQIEELALYSVTARLASYLLEQEGNDTLNTPEITRAIIAGRLATTPETISRALRKLAATGAITFDRQDITVQDADLLRSIATGGEPICQR